MIRKTSFVMAGALAASLFSFTAQATALASITLMQKRPVKRPVARCIPTVNQPTTFNSQVKGNGVEVSWTTPKTSACQNVESFRVSVLLMTARGESLRLEKRVASGLTKTTFIVPADKVHIFFASDAKLKIKPTVIEG